MISPLTLFASTEVPSALAMYVGSSCFRSTKREARVYHHKPLILRRSHYLLQLRCKFCFNEFRGTFFSGYHELLSQCQGLTTAGLYHQPRPQAFLPHSLSFFERGRPGDEASLSYSS